MNIKRYLIFTFNIEQLIVCLLVAKPSQWHDSAAMIIVIDVLTGVKKRTVVIVVVLLLHQDFLGQ